MFQLSDFSIHDRNISHNRIPHRAVIKSVADYAKGWVAYGLLCHGEYQKS